MKDDRRLKRAQFLLTGSALGLAACSNASLSPLAPLAPLAKRALVRRLKDRATGPAALLQGYNSVLGNACSTALNGTFASTGAVSSVVCTVCTSASEVASALEIDASLSVAYGALASVDAKTKFMSSLNITTYSITIVVHAKHSIGSERFTNVRLKDYIAAPGTDEEADSFVRTYGDSWISEISKGGEYFATYTFFSETRTEQQNLEVSLRASGIVSGVTVEANLQAKMSQFVSTSNVTTTFKQTITGIRNPTFPDPADFVPFALNFSSLELDSPTIIGFASKGYESGVAGFKASPSFDKVAANRRYFTQGDYTQPSLASNLATVAGIKNQISAIKQIHDFYGYTGDSVLSSRSQVAKTDFDAIVTQMQRFETAPTSSFTRPSLPSIANGTPVFDAAYFYSPEFVHGNGGIPFSDVDVSTYFQNRTRIVKVQLRAGAYVDQIITTYEDVNRSWVTSHGESGGNLTTALQLLRGQFVVSVSGRGDAWIDRLRIAITDGRYVEGGGNGGYAFSWTAPGGAIVMGFRGRAGAWVDRIGIDYAQIKPAKWSAVPDSLNANPTRLRALS